AEGCKRYPIACVRDEAIWQYELRGRDPLVTQVMVIIESPDGEPVGILRHLPTLGRRGLIVTLYELKQDVSWLEMTPAVMRYIWKMGQEYAQASGKPCSGFVFSLGESHPVYDLFRERLPEKPRSYAWYLRVSDLPRFLMHIAPALERRLAESLACGYSGEKCVSFYRSGLRMGFTRGRLAAVEPWQPGPRELEGDIAFPGLTFLQVLFGYRSLYDLRNSFADCCCNTNETRALFDALFPKKPSQVVGLS
ncbi:MAG: GNAT family N-acetyltransferase, partial [Anaerolineae bacterium]